MGISKFMIVLIIFTILFLFVEKDYLIQTVKKEERPTVSFFDSTMYEITETRVNQIVKSKQADIYDKKEELFDATIVVKVSKNNFDSNIGSSEKMLKTGDNVTFTNNVNLQFANGLNLKTEELHYNLDTEIAHNSIPFVVTRDGSSFTGNSLFLNSKTEELTAEKAKFRMKVENNE